MVKYLPVILLNGLSTLTSQSNTSSSLKEPLKGSPLRPYQLNQDSSIYTGVSLLFGSGGPSHRVYATNATLTTGSLEKPDPQSLVEIPLDLSLGLGFVAAFTSPGKSGPNYMIEYEIYLPYTSSLQTVTSSLNRMQSSRSILIEGGATETLHEISGDYEVISSGRAKVLYNRGSFYADQLSLTPQIGVDFYSLSHAITTYYTQITEESSKGDGITALVNYEDVTRVGPTVQAVVRQSLGKSTFFEAMFAASGLYNQYTLSDSENFITTIGVTVYSQNMTTKSLIRVSSALYSSLGFGVRGTFRGMNLEFGASYKTSQLPQATFVTGSNFGPNAMQEQNMSSHFGEIRLAAIF